MWEANIIAPVGMHFLCIALCYNKPDKSKAFNFFLSFNKARIRISRILIFQVIKLNFKNSNIAS